MPSPMVCQFGWIAVVAVTAVAASSGIAAEKTRTGIVTEVNASEKSFVMKYAERLESVENRFDAAKIANFTDIKRGVKLSVTYDEATLVVSRVFSFGAAKDEDAGNDDAKKKGGSISLSSKDADIASQCKTAKEVVLAYEAALRNLTLDADEKERIEGELARWKTAADQNLVRVGNNWIPAQKAVELRERAAKMVKEAGELMAVKNDRLAMKLLTEAINLDPESYNASFMAGLVSCYLEDLNGALKYFRICLQRSPDNVALLSNLALVEIGSKKFKDAGDHWIRAANLDPQNPAIAQNLGVFVAVANAKKIVVPQRTVDEASRVYLAMVNGNDRLRADLKRGFIFYIPPGLGGPKRAGDDTYSDSGSTLGQGSGFVVAPGYVLTNRHVAEDAKGFYVLDPKDPKIRHPAETVAIIPEPGPDLAILRCPGLTAPALPIRGAELPRVASEVMATGFPQAADLGTQAKSTVGRIIALPDPKLEGVLLYDAGTDGGNSGGPVCDQYGDVVAVHALGFKFKINANGGVPIGDAIPFLKKNVPGFTLAGGSRANKEWPDVAEAQRRSTVLIAILDSPVKVPKEMARVVNDTPSHTSSPSKPADPGSGLDLQNWNIIAGDYVGDSNGKLVAKTSGAGAVAFMPRSPGARFEIEAYVEDLQPTGDGVKRASVFLGDPRDGGKSYLAVDWQPENYMVVVRPNSGEEKVHYRRATNLNQRKPGRLRVRVWDGWMYINTDDQFLSVHKVEEFPLAAPLVGVGIAVNRPGASATFSSIAVTTLDSEPSDAGIEFHRVADAGYALASSGKDNAAVEAFSKYTPNVGGYIAEMCQFIPRSFENRDKVRIGKATDLLSFDNQAGNWKGNLNQWEKTNDGYTAKAFKGFNRREVALDLRDYEFSGRIEWESSANSRLWIEMQVGNRNARHFGAVLYRPTVGLFYSAHKPAIAEAKQIRAAGSETFINVAIRKQGDNFSVLENGKVVATDIVKEMEHPLHGTFAIQVYTGDPSSKVKFTNLKVTPLAPK